MTALEVILFIVIIVMIIVYMETIYRKQVKKENRKMEEAKKEIYLDRLIKAAHDRHQALQKRYFDLQKDYEKLKSFHIEHEIQKNNLDYRYGWLLNEYAVEQLKAVQDAGASNNFMDGLAYSYATWITKEYIRDISPVIDKKIDGTL